MDFLLNTYPMISNPLKGISSIREHGMTLPV
jgi:hypothetical protein